MKNSVRTLAALMAAVCVLGCSKEADNHIEEPVEKEKEPVVIEKVPMTFSVGTAKTVLIPRTGQSGFDIGFHKVDKISIFDRNGDNNDFVNDASNDGQLEVKFSGKAEMSDTYYALYPYQSGAELGENKIKNVVLPDTQTATANSFDPKANISVDKASGNTLYLKNVCSLFKIVVNAGEHYDKAVISSNDGTPICGTFSIDFDTEINPVVRDITNGFSAVTLSGAMGDDTEQTVYYAVILPKTYDNGISVKLYNSEKQTTPLAMRASSPSTKIERAKIATFGHIKPDLLSKEFTIDKDGGKVRFSKGNLWCNASADEASKWVWALEENQYDSNTGTKQGANQRIYNNTHVSHFYYSANGLKAGDNGYGAGPNRISGQDSGVNIGLVFGQDSKWTVLEKDEMKYLLETRETGATVGTTTNARYSPIQVNGKDGLMIFPDTFTWDTSLYGDIPTNINKAGSFKDYTATFGKLEKDGVVFLPSNGLRNTNGYITYAMIGFPNNFTIGYYSFLNLYYNGNQRNFTLSSGSGSNCEAATGPGNAYSVRLVKHISSSSN